jgi:hypothetical protein
VGRGWARLLHQQPPGCCTRLCGLSDALVCSRVQGQGRHSC